jgi:hypothetical protein
LTERERDPRVFVTHVTSSESDGSVAEHTPLDGKIRSDYRCAGCGYGVVVMFDLPSVCPMCGGSSWDRAPGQPLSAAVETFAAPSSTRRAT